MVMGKNVIKIIYFKKDSLELGSLEDSLGVLPAPHSQAAECAGSAGARGNCAGPRGPRSAAWARRGRQARAPPPGAAPAHFCSSEVGSRRCGCRLIGETRYKSCRI